MNPTESLRVALRALAANKLRASLTMLGMIIGVGAVIALMSIGKGIQTSVTAQIARLASGAQTVSQINVQLADNGKETKDAAVQAIGELLRERHRVTQDDFTIRSQDDLLATATQVTGFITLFLGAVAGISLLVGGIGIMNIMLVSVTERTREIGIRKAIGAKRRDILAQFLIEATVVSVVGGAIGIAVGGGGSRLLDGIRFGGPDAQPVSTLVTPDAIVLAFTVSVLIGLFFGVYPAIKASRLNPIEALRYE